MIVWHILGWNLKQYLWICAQASVQSSIVRRAYVNTCYAWRDISILSEVISIKQIFMMWVGIANVVKDCLKLALNSVVSWGILFM